MGRDGCKGFTDKAFGCTHCNRSREQSRAFVGSVVPADFCGYCGCTNQHARENIKQCASASALSRCIVPGFPDRADTRNRHGSAGNVASQEAHMQNVPFKVSPRADAPPVVIA